MELIHDAVERSLRLRPEAHAAQQAGSKKNHRTPVLLDSVPLAFFVSTHLPLLALSAWLAGTLITFAVNGLGPA